MFQPEKPQTGERPESPTTARELNFEDEPLESAAVSISHPPAREINQSGLAEEVPPPKPPRPSTSGQQAENTLKEAFPSIDAAVIRAVLRASGGVVEPAFNALLGMSDPESQIDPTPPLQPPRPNDAPHKPTSTAQSQLLADEQYARQLAQHYSGTAAHAGAPRTGSRGRQNQNFSSAKQETGLRPKEGDENREYSFIDDDLPVIRDNIKKGFLETQSKVNSWVASLRKKIDGDDDENNDQGRPAQDNQGFGSRPSPQQYGNRRSGETGRRSADRDRYDADPQVLGDDFATLHIRDHEDPPRRPSRPLANPDLFKPTPPRPQSGNGRRVSFQEGPPEEIEIGRRASPDPVKRPPSNIGKTSKWQPLSTADPNPVVDHDPFSLGDSDDEETKKKDIRLDDGEKRAQVGAKAEDAVAPPKGPEPHEISASSGTQDKEPDNLMSAKT